MYTAPNPGWANNPYDTRDPRKFISFGLLSFTFILHIVSGCIPQATTANGDSINLFSSYIGYDSVDTFISCSISIWLVLATISFVAASLMLMACIGLMIMNFARSFQPHAPVMVVMAFCAVALIAQPVFILIFQGQGNSCWFGSADYTLGAGFILACFLPPLAVACMVPSYLMYKSHQAINQQRQLEIQEALTGGSPAAGSPTGQQPSPMASPMMYQQPNVMYASHQPNMVYMTSGGGVIYMQQPGVVYQQQPMMYQQQQQQQSPMNQTVVMGVEVPQQ